MLEALEILRKLAGATPETGVLGEGTSVFRKMRASNSEACTISLGSYEVNLSAHKLVSTCSNGTMPINLLSSSNCDMQFLLIQLLTKTSEDLFVNSDTTASTLCEISEIFLKGFAHHQ